ncbi:MAG TPA: hypothetical protein VHO29_05500 [Marmoricola sp.]|nr:hypothetical protein [Marmoricola sp.]
MFVRYDPAAQTRNLVVMNADGTDQTGLTSADGTIARVPAWAPDGSRIVFDLGNMHSGDTYLNVINADGTGLRQVSSDPTAQDAAWAPNGSTIAFAKGVYGDGTWGIYTAGADGGSATRVTTQDLDTDPAWSPDGTQIAFSGYGSANARSIFVVDVDGTHLTRLTNDLRGNDSDPAWSPDGTKILFTSNRDGDNEIYVMNADGTGQTDLSQNAASDMQPSWSPDGSKIVFATSRDSTGIYTMDADGSNQTPVAGTTTNDYAPAWGPTYVPPPPPPPPTPLTSTPGGVDLSSATAAVGAPLTAVVLGNWQAGATTLRPRFQWYAALGQDWTPIPGASLASFTPTLAQYGQYLRVDVTATAPAGYQSPAVLASSPVRVGPGTLLTARPVIHGTLRVGHRLLVSTGTWHAEASVVPPGVFRYRWYVGGRVVRAATGASLRLTPAMVGRRVRVKVSGRLPGYTPASAYSRMSRVVRR